MVFRDTLRGDCCWVRNVCSLPQLCCQAHNTLQTRALRSSDFQQKVFHVKGKKKNQGDRFWFLFIFFESYKKMVL